MEWNIYLIASLLTCAIMLSIGALTIIKDPKSKKNLSFCLLAISMSAWALSNYFSNDHQISYDSALAANKLVFTCAALSVASLLLTVNQIIGYKLSFGKILILLLSLTSAISVSLTPWVVNTITIQDSVYAIEFGFLAVFYFISIVPIIGLLLHSLTLARNFTNNIDKKRIASLKITLGVSLITLILTNYILPILGIFQLTPIGLIAFLEIAVSFAYQVMNYGLFRLRPSILKAFSSSAIILIISIVYNLFAIVIATLIFGVTGVSSDNILALSVFVVLANIIFSPAKKHIETGIKKMSREDFYETGNVLDQVNHLLVKSMSTKKIADNIASVLSENLKPEFCVIAIRNNDNITIYSSKKHSLNQNNIKSIYESHPGHSHTEVLDRMPWGNDALKDAMSRTNIEILSFIDISASVNIMTESKLDIDGFILLGAKQSGTGYTQKDINLLQSISKSISIGFKNSYQFEYIENFNAILKEDIAKATLELRHKNQQLHKLDHAKDDFVVMASHQLRTPLTSIRGYISMILDGDIGKVSPEQHKVLNEVYASCAQVTFLIGDLLDMSRIQTGKWFVHKTPIALDNLIDSEISQLSLTSRSRDIELVFEKPEGLPTVMCDENKIRQVVMNMIDNAIYYSPAKSKIAIDLYQDDQDVVFTVHDRGIGVPESEKENLFKKFYRAENARKTRPDGTGIGLFMARKVILGHGGQVIFESKEGEGSTFGFRIPINPPQLVENQ